MLSARSVVAQLPAALRSSRRPGRRFSVGSGSYAPVVAFSKPDNDLIGACRVGDVEAAEAALAAGANIETHGINKARMRECQGNERKTQ